MVKKNKYPEIKPLFFTDEQGSECVFLDLDVYEAILRKIKTATTAHKSVKKSKKRSVKI